MTRHLESRARRRWPWMVVTIVLGIASIGAAVVFIRQDTAPETFEAIALGGIDIGNAATEGIYLEEVDLTGIQPGDVFTSCIGAALTNPTGEDDPRIWIAQVSGGLAPYLTVELGQMANAGDIKPPGLSKPQGGFGTCTKNSLAYTVGLSARPLTSAASTLNGWENGIPWLNGLAKTELRVRVAMPEDVPVASILGQSATLKIAFENRPAPAG